METTTVLLSGAAGNIPVLIMFVILIIMILRLNHRIDLLIKDIQHSNEVHQITFRHHEIRLQKIEGNDKSAYNSLVSS